MMLTNLELTTQRCSDPPHEAIRRPSGRKSSVAVSDARRRENVQIGTDAFVESWSRRADRQEATTCLAQRFKDPNEQDMCELCRVRRYKKEVPTEVL